MEAEVLVVPTSELRPHDRIVTAPAPAFGTGSQIQLVVDAIGNPFPQDPRTMMLRIFGAAGEEAVSIRDAGWEVVRGRQDDCRACFLFDVTRSVGALD